LYRIYYNILFNSNDEYFYKIKYKIKYDNVQFTSKKKSYPKTTL